MLLKGAAMLGSELGLSCFLRLSELEFRLQGSIFIPLSARKVQLPRYNRTHHQVTFRAPARLASQDTCVRPRTRVKSGPSPRVYLKF